MSLDDQLENYLQTQRQENLYRLRSVRQNHQTAFIHIDNQEYLNFCSNDYLGLANHPEIISAAHEGLKDYGVGSGASALITGHTKIHQQLEDALAEFTKRSKVLLFSSGFVANVGILSALADKNTNLIMDKFAHASLIDGAKLSAAKLRRYHHLDMTNLEGLLSKVDQNQSWVVTESLFSMDGDFAPLKKFSDICHRHAVNSYVDDAHGFGIYGENGAGRLNEACLNEEHVPVMVATFGKAFGISGAFVAGSEKLIETLIQKARSYIYSTAMPPAMAAAILKSLELVKKESWRREKLFDLVGYFRGQASARNIPISENAHGPIQPIIVGDSDQALKSSQLLLEKGIKISAIRPPTVPENTSRLRITFSAAHEKKHIDSLISALGDVLAI